MKNIALMGLAVLCFVCSSQAQDHRHIHVLKILDSYNYEATLQNAAQVMDYEIDMEVRLLADKMGIFKENVHTYDLSGKRFCKDSLQWVVEMDMTYCKNDIVILVYLGHGFRSKDNWTDYPELYLGNFDESVYFYDLLMDIIDKKPSVVLSIVNACNNDIGITTRPPQTPTTDFGSDYVVASVSGERQTRRYEELFKMQGENQAVSIEFISARKGDVSYISREGGIFFREVMNSFRKHLSKNYSIVWNDILEESERVTTKQTQDQLNRTQQPQCQRNFYFHPQEVSASRRKSRMQERNPKRYSVIENREAHQELLEKLKTRHAQEWSDAKARRTSTYEMRKLAEKHRQELDYIRLKMRTTKGRIKDEF